MARHKTKRRKTRKKSRAHGGSSRRRAKLSRADGQVADAEEIQLITAAWANGTSVTSTPVAAADIPFLQIYLAAHSLLPPGFDCQNEKSAAVIDEALEVIADPNATASAILRAIVVLGHTPSAMALTALQQHAATDKIHAPVARLAADECVGWISHMQPDTATAMAS